ncbi:hypothetical protein ACLB2K_005507 [Fragaria x ananassa]
MKTETADGVKEEVEKMFKSGIIRVEKYNEWLSNIVHVHKKKGKIRVGVDYRDLNKATPKDVYPMLVADMLIDVVAGHEMLSFMDGTAGYHQIPVAEVDRHKTAFRCPTFIGAFEYVVMPFGLKNARATYQRAMNLIFHDILGKILEVYIDDVVVKSKVKQDHITDLRKVFERMRTHGLRMNPTKCVFGVHAGDFLGFVVHQRGIVVPRDKAKAIINAPAPKTKKELQQLLGKINFLRRFISNSAAKVKPFSSLLKLQGAKEFVWEPCHQEAFDKIKEYLANPSVLVPPKPEFSLQYTPLRAQTSQAVSDFLLHPPIAEDHYFRDFNIGAIYLQPWTLYFEGSSTDKLSSAGMSLVSPSRGKYPYSFQLEWRCTNNQVEYEAIIIGQEMLLDLGAQDVNILDWRQPIMGYLINPSTITDKRIRFIPLNYVLKGCELLRRGENVVDFLCVYGHEAKRIMPRFTWASVDHIRLVLRCAGLFAGMVFIGLLSLKIASVLQKTGGAAFMADETQEFLSDYEIKFLHSTPYYAQSNGQAEASNKIIFSILRQMLADNPRD